jgi:hypothetical protein
MTAQQCAAWQRRLPQNAERFWLSTAAEQSSSDLKLSMMPSTLNVCRMFCWPGTLMAQHCVAVYQTAMEA